VLRPEQVIRGLEGHGFRFIGQKGSHRKYKNGGRAAIVPMHYEIAKGTLQSILEQAGLTLDELAQYI
jgi:predicted RNA binding protein YcfA (HicA-like mRNA interferase family)